MTKAKNVLTKVKYVLSFIFFQNEVISKKIKNGAIIKITSLRVKNATPKNIPVKIKLK
jgi:hypothetical protein